MTEPQKQTIDLNVEGIRENIKLFMATPMYGGMCNGLYTKSLMDTTAVCNMEYLIKSIIYLMNL